MEASKRCSKVLASVDWEGTRLIDFNLELPRKSVLSASANSASAAPAQSVRFRKAKGPERTRKSQVTGL